MRCATTHSFPVLKQAVYIEAMTGCVNAGQSWVRLAVEPTRFVATGCQVG